MLANNRGCFRSAGNITCIERTDSEACKTLGGEASLGLAALIQWHIDVSLVLQGDIPWCFAMANEDDAHRYFLGMRVAVRGDAAGVYYIAIFLAAVGFGRLS